MYLKSAISNYGHDFCTALQGWFALGVHLTAGRGAAVDWASMGHASMDHVFTSGISPRVVSQSLHQRNVRLDPGADITQDALLV